jgi:hypothetical protein
VFEGSNGARLFAAKGVVAAYQVVGEPGGGVFVVLGRWLATQGVVLGLGSNIRPSSCQEVQQGGRS